MGSSSSNTTGVGFRLKLVSRFQFAPLPPVPESAGMVADLRAVHRSSVGPGTDLQ